jgi:hypothetical protein
MLFSFNKFSEQETPAIISLSPASGSVRTRAWWRGTPGLWIVPALLVTQGPRPRRETETGDGREIQLVQYTGLDFGPAFPTSTNANASAIRQRLPAWQLLLCVAAHWQRGRQRNYWDACLPCQCPVRLNLTQPCPWYWLRTSGQRYLSFCCGRFLPPLFALLMLSCSTTCRLTFVIESLKVPRFSEN